MPGRRRGAKGGLDGVPPDRHELFREPAVEDRGARREDLDVGTWSIERVHSPRLGAIAVVMRTPDGKAFQVDLLRRDDAVPGVAATRHFSLFVSNSGKGDTATDEYQARGAIVLAHQIRHRELSGAPAPKLMSFAERSNSFPFGAFGVLG